MRARTVGLCLAWIIGGWLTGCGFTLPPEKGGQDLDMGVYPGNDAAPRDAGAELDMAGAGGGGGGDFGLVDMHADAVVDAGAPDMNLCDEDLVAGAACDPLADCCGASTVCDADAAEPVCRRLCRTAADCPADAWCDDTQDPPLCQDRLDCDVGGVDPCMCGAAVEVGGACVPGADCCGPDARCGRVRRGAASACRAGECVGLGADACPADQRCRVVGFDVDEVPFGVCTAALDGVPVGESCAQDPADLTGRCAPGLVCGADAFGETRCVALCDAAHPCPTGVCHAGRCLPGCDPTAPCPRGRCQFIAERGSEAGVVAEGLCVPSGARALGDRCAVDRYGVDDCGAVGSICDPASGRCRLLCGGPFGAPCGATACLLTDDRIVGVCEDEETQP